MTPYTFPSPAPDRPPLPTSWHRERIDLLAWIGKRAPCEHITYDPHLKRGDYVIRRQHAHDGTAMFTDWMLGEIANLLLGRWSYYKPREAEYLAHRERIQYVIGPLWLMTSYGYVRLPAGVYPGQHERMRVAVRMVVP